MSHATKLFLAAISIFGAQLAFCDPLYTFSSVNSTFTDAPLTLGFVFSANTDFEVTSLGWFSVTADGFQTAHTVGIYDSTGNLLTSANLAAGTSTTLDGFFRYQSIAPITLNAGSDYVIAGTSGGPLDSWTVNDRVSGFMVNPALTIGADAARFSYGTDLVNPTSHFSDYVVYAGPNLEGNGVVSATPEPASVLLVFVAAAAIVSLRKFRLSRAA